MIALSLVDSEKLNVALGAITVLFAELLASMAVFNKISGQATGVMKSVTAKNTDWFTLAKGDNIFAFTADSGVTNLQFRIENKVIYEGV